MEKNAFFDMAAAQGLALVFSDAGLIPAHTSLRPDENHVDLRTHFSRRIELKIPLVSAAMDKVTEHKLAIALALLGGIGVIHRNFSDPEQQVKEVARVKYYLGGRVNKPITAQPQESVQAVLARIEAKEYPFSSLPVVTEDGYFKGIVTSKDFEFCTDPAATMADIMTQNPTTALPDTTPVKAFQIMQQKKKKVLPLVVGGRLRGMYTWKDVKRVVLKDTNGLNIDSQGRLRVAAAIGVGPGVAEQAEALLAEGVDALVIDTAHGDTDSVFDQLQQLREVVKDACDIVAGNVSQPGAIRQLIALGADGIKVGQGPGSICTTSDVTGAAFPQLSAIYQCAKVAKATDLTCPIIGDGGIRNPGDLTKALAAGADCVMCGSQFAGTKEAPGDEQSIDGRLYKEYRGMGSLAAMQRGPAAERYHQRSSRKLVPEGVEGLVPYRGELHEVVFQLLGGLRAGMCAVNAPTIPALQTQVAFYRMTEAGQREAHPHDIIITRDPPNYRP